MIAGEFGSEALGLSSRSTITTTATQANDIAARAVRLGRPHADLEVWANQVYTAVPVNVAVEVTEVSAEKAEAIRVYATQTRRREWARCALASPVAARYDTSAPPQ